MKLKDIVDVAVNNNECVVLKVNDGHEMDLISLGCFDGDETMLRLTKGASVTCTVFRKDGKHFSWNWGAGGYTLVTDKTREIGRKVQDCIENDFGILCMMR